MPPIIPIVLKLFISNHSFCDAGSQDLRQYSDEKDDKHSKHKRPDCLGTLLFEECYADVVADNAEQAPNKPSSIITFPFIR